MTDLKTLVQTLRETQERANIDIESISWQTRPSVSMMKRDAEEQLVKLREEYSRRVRSNSLGMFIFGEPERVAQFTKIAGEEAGVLVVNGAEAFESLADQIEPSFGLSREFGATQLGILHNALNNKRKDLGIRAMQMPRLKDLAVSRDRAETTDMVRRMIHDAVGDDFLRIAVDFKINQEAVSREFAESILPVAVTGITAEEITALATLFTNSVSVEVGTSEDGEVTKEYVLNKLSGLRKRIKGKTNNATA